jgi:hypothetical protein
LVLVEIVTGAMASSNSLSELQRNWLVFFVVLFPVLIFGFFCYMWRFQFWKLFRVSIIKNERTLIKIFEQMGAKPLPRLKQPWSNEEIWQADTLTGGVINQSTMHGLFVALQNKEPWHYCIGALLTWLRLPNMFGRFDVTGPQQLTSSCFPQVDPDIQVMNDPKTTAEGRDLQLERAIAELMKEN